MDNKKKHFSLKGELIKSRALMRKINSLGLYRVSNMVTTNSFPLKLSELLKGFKNKYFDINTA